MNSEVYELEYVKAYFKIDHDMEDILLYNIIQQAKNYILNYTDLPEEDWENSKELAYAFLLLVDSMYAQRSIVLDPSKVNPMLDKILNLNTNWEVF